MAQKKFSITLDTTEFIRSTKQLEEVYNRLQRQLETSVKFPSMENDVSKASREVDLLGDSFKRAGALAAGIFAVNGLQDFVQRVVSVRGEFQQLEIAFRSMLGSGEQASALMDQLTRTAASTPFDLQGIAESAKQMIAFGFEAEKVNDTIVRLGNVASGLSQPLGDIVYLYGTLKASGRVTTIDMRQFANRGIPIYEELAKVLGKSVTEVNALVSAGKVGFPDIERAFLNMTNEGGKFYNLMQEQSKSLTGQISNLQDNLDMMFNEIGKASEGVISKGIEGVAFLVENYQTVGKVIGALIATYGVYRASVILNIALTKSWAVASRTDAIAKGIQTLATNATTLATKRLTAALLANPYGAIAVAITAVVSLMWAFSDSMSSAEKAQSEYNKRKEEATRAEEEHKKKVEELLAVVQNEANSTGERKDALAQLSAFYPEIFAKYDIEALKLADILKLKREIAEYDGRKKLETSKKTYEDAEAEVARIEGLIREWEGKRSKNINLTERRQILSALRERLEGAKKTLELSRRDYGRLADSQTLSEDGISKLDDSKLRALISNTKQAIARAKKYGKQEVQVMLSGSELLGAYDAKGWNTLLARLEQEQSSRAKQFKSYSDQVKDAKGAEAKALRDLQDFNKLTASQLKDRQKQERDKGNYSWDADAFRKKLSEEYATKKKEREAKEKEAGQTSKSSRKADAETPEHRRAVQAEARRQQELRMARETAKAQRDTELALEGERLELEREGFAKEMAQLQYQHKRKLASLDDQAQERIAKLQDQRRLEWEATHNSKNEVYKAPTLTENDLGAVDREQLRVGRELADKALSQGEQKLIKELQDKYASYEERKTEVARKFTDERKAIAESAYLSDAQRTSLIVELERRKTEELKRIDSERYEHTQRTNELMVQLFLQQGERTASQMRETITTTKELLDYLATTKSADLAPKFGMSADDLRAIQDSPERLKAITDALQGLQGELANVSPWEAFATNLTGAIDKAKQALADYKRARKEAEGATSEEDKARAEKKAKDAMGVVGLSVSKIGKSVQDATPLVKELGQSLGTLLGNDELSEQIGMLTEAMGDLGSVATGVGKLMSGDVLGGITSIVGTIAGIVGRSRKIEKEAEEARKKALGELTRAQNEYNVALLRQNLLYERGMTIFGEDTFGKTKNAIDVARQAMSDFRKQVAFTKEELEGDGALDFLGVPNGGSGVEGKAVRRLRDELRTRYANTLSGEFDKLLNVRVKTGEHTTGALWWKKRHEDFDTIGKLYPKLIDQNGKLNLALAETILKNHEFADGHKEVLERAIELQKQVEESAKVVSDYMQGIFGQLGNSITDSLIAALRRGEDATQAFTKSVSEMLNNFIKQMAYSAVLAPIFEQAQKDVTEAMNNVGLSDEDRFSRIAEVMQRTVEDAKRAEPIFKKMIETNDKIARERGFDTKGTTTDSRSATAKGIAQASQDSIDVLTGLWHTNVLLSERTANATERMASVLTAGSYSARSLPTPQDLGLDQIGEVQRKMYAEIVAIQQNTKASALSVEAVRFILAQIDSNGLKLRK